MLLVALQFLAEIAEVIYKVKLIPTTTARKGEEMKGEEMKGEDDDNEIKCKTNVRYCRSDRRCWADSRRKRDCCANQEIWATMAAPSRY